MIWVISSLLPVTYIFSSPCCICLGSFSLLHKLSFHCSPWSPFVAHLSFFLMVPSKCTNIAEMVSGTNKDLQSFVIISTLFCSSKCTNIVEMVSRTNKEVQECEDQWHVNILAKWAWLLCHYPSLQAWSDVSSVMSGTQCTILTSATPLAVLPPNSFVLIICKSTMLRKCLTVNWLVFVGYDLITMTLFLEQKLCQCAFSLSTCNSFNIVIQLILSL